MDIKIEKGFAVVTALQQFIDAFAKMEHGDSFVCERKIYHRVRAAAKEINVKIIVRSISDKEIRVWYMGKKQ
jgi:hypothetical protein